ncbi:hypothetical protein [Actinoplanes sp. GCM10030250]|uniref:hypothetical protein n=1 Tax=Actinoplanes sp. GCM10030250 TaxID=3273376 RepID=UPI00360A5E97
MNSSTRSALVAGVAALSMAVSGALGGAVVGGTAASAAAPSAAGPGLRMPSSSAALPVNLPPLEFYDWYDSEKECRDFGFKGIAKTYWFNYECIKAEGRYAGKFGLYVEVNRYYDGPPWTWPW